MCQVRRSGRALSVDAIRRFRHHSRIALDCMMTLHQPKIAVGRYTLSLTCEGHIFTCHRDGYLALSLSRETLSSASALSTRVTAAEWRKYDPKAARARIAQLARRRRRKLARLVLVANLHVLQMSAMRPVRRPYGHGALAATPVLIARPARSSSCSAFWQAMRSRAMLHR